MVRSESIRGVIACLWIVLLGIPIAASAQDQSNQSLVVSHPQLKEAWQVMVRSSKAQKLYAEALKRRQVQRLKLVPLLPSARLPYGCFDAKKKTIYVNPQLSLSSRVAVLLGEVYRAWDVEDDFEREASEGKLARSEYVFEAEKRGYKLVKKHHDISEEAVKKGLWPAGTDWYREPLRSWRSFEHYLAAMNIAMQGDGPSHADHFRRRWDRFYRKKFLARIQKLRS